MARAPKRGRPKGSTRDATRARILAAARFCFAETGYAGTTNGAIAARAGLTAAALYQYFPSKTALYLAAVHAAEGELVPAFRAAVKGAPTAREAFVRLLFASVELHERDPSLTAFLSALPVEIRRHREIADEIAARPGEVVAILVEVVERGVRRREIAKGRADGVLAMFVASTIGLSLFAAAIDGTQLRAAVEAVAASLDGSLFAVGTVTQAKLRTKRR